MKKSFLVLPIVIALISAGFLTTRISAAPDPSLDLTGVSNFAILANTYTNTGAGTVLVGDLGYTVPPANPPTVFGTTFTSTSPTYISAEAIQANLIATANDPTLTGACTTTLTAATVLDSLPQPLAPGIYCITGAVSVNVGITLSGDGVYLFRLGGALNTAAGSNVLLAGNAKAGNVFWVPVGATTLGANSVFAGNVLSNAAITVGTIVGMNGRILSNGAVTTGPSDTIVAPPATTTTTTVTTSTATTTATATTITTVTVTATTTSTETTTVGAIIVTTPPVSAGTIFTLHDQESCQKLGGIWTAATSTCTVSTLTINSGNTLVIASSVTLSNTGLITDLGTITNSGPVINTGTITIGPTGILTTTNTFSNTGTITSSGTVTNNGPVTNGPTGTITSTGLITNTLTGTIKK